MSGTKEASAFPDFYLLLGDHSWAGQKKHTEKSLSNSCQHNPSGLQSIQHKIIHVERAGEETGGWGRERQGKRDRERDREDASILGDPQIPTLSVMIPHGFTGETFQG